MHTLATAAQLRLAFGAAATGGCRWGEDGAGDEFQVAVPVLEGPPGQLLLSAQGPEAHPGTWGRVRVLRDPSSGLVAGAAAAPAGASPEAAARAIYSDLLDGLGAGGRGLSLYRAWNFIPDINRSRAGLENYRAFNRGRWDAFSDRFGESAMEAQLPAASAVGVGGGGVAVVFLAGSDPVQHHENPRQIPAYHYPGEHGPRAPSFARGSVVDHRGSAGDAAGTRTVYLSGTSSIIGHETVGEGDLAAQTETTLDNVDEMLRTMRVGDPSAGTWRVYLRDPTDLAAVRASFFGRFPAADGRTQFVHADICRSPLQLEIEAVFDLDSPVT